MTESVSNLWQKIQAFRLDNPFAAVPFSQKLANEHQWSPSFTHRAIAEYKKFMLLCATCPEGASPSETVDKVWHLHLTYTTNYWTDFCQNTIGKNIDHHPSEGGATENTKHQDWYSSTLRNYVSYFDQPPPKDIWTYPTDFAFENQLSRNALYQKVAVQPTEPPTLSQKAEYFLYAYLLVLAILLGIFGNPFALNGSHFLTFYGVFAIATILPIAAQHIERQIAFDKTKYLLPDGLHAYHLAYLGGGKQRMLETAIVALTEQMVLSFNKENKNFNIHRNVLINGLESNPLYHTVMALEGNTVDGQTLSAIFEPLATPLAQSINLSSLEFKPNFIITQAQWSWYYIGAVRFFQGLTMEKPISYLFFSMGVYWVISQVIQQSIAADYAIFKLIQTKYRDNSTENAHVYALDGNIAISSFDFLNASLMFAALQPPKKTNDSIAGCSSGSDGGSSDGGGCGGCGGD
ncbi:MAG: hypothetical protein RLZZ628_4454 [Bacteroidota bacterium]|jgi:hypothetical protein